MLLESDSLHTPVHLKTGDDFAWPDNESIFYLLTRDGLFLCRDHPFFRSSVRVDQWPAELARHAPWLMLNYPKLPRRLFERVVGFFSLVGRRRGSEAAVLLVWNTAEQRIEVIVPEQVGIVCEGLSGNVYPMKLHYEIPPLPSHFMLVGDIHSHVNAAAYASGTDQADEQFRPGLHLVVGRLQSEPPVFHCEVIVDGTRFRVRDMHAILTGYQGRREGEVPREWLEKVTVKPWSSSEGWKSYPGSALHEARQPKAIATPGPPSTVGQEEIDRETDEGDGEVTTVRSPSPRPNHPNDDASPSLPPKP